MPMIDVYAVEGTFADRHALARDLAAAVMRSEQVPDLALFRDKTAAFVHDLEADSGTPHSLTANAAQRPQRRWISHRPPPRPRDLGAHRQRDLLPRGDCARRGAAPAI